MSIESNEIERGDNIKQGELNKEEKRCNQKQKHCSAEDSTGKQNDENNQI
jgi:hypothetical protein